MTLSTSASESCTRTAKRACKPLQAGRGIQRGLAGADEKKALVQLRAAMLGDFLQIHRALDFLADELLNFVHDEQRAGEVAFLAEDLLEEVERLAHGGRGDIGKAGTNRLLDVGHRSVFRVGGQECLGKGHRIIQIRHFLEQIAVVLL